MAYLPQRGGFSLGGRGREGIAKRIARGEEGGGSPDLWERRLFVPNYFLSICPGCVRWTDPPTALFKGERSSRIL